MAFIISTVYADKFRLRGTDGDDEIIFNGGPATPGGTMDLLIMGGAGDDVINTSPTFENIRYNIYADWSVSLNPEHLRAPGGDHLTNAGNDTIHFGRGAFHVKGGRSHPEDNGGVGDTYIMHGHVPRAAAPEMMWFDVHEGDKFVFARDDVKRAGGGGLGYRVEGIKAVAIGEDTVEFFSCYLGGFSKNKLIDQQWVHFGVGDDLRGGHQRTLLERDPGDSVNDTVREWLWEHTGNGPDDFIL